MSFILLIVGFVLLIKGADLFVDSSVNIAKRLKIPNLIIGLTIVAIGTGAPEAVISITASLQGSNDLAIGNIVGSNIFNLMFVVGICGIIKPFTINLKSILVNYWIAIGAAVALLLLKLLGGDYIPRIGSLFLFIAFVVYLSALIVQAKNKTIIEDDTHKENNEKTKPLPINILLAVLGCSMIIIGGHFTVVSATEIAVTFGITERIIGLTIVAVGTSLPELVIFLVACKKGENDVALGNIIGSSIFNILFVLGLTGMISPLTIDINLTFDTIVLIMASLITLIFFYTGKRLVRFEGFAMVASFMTYMLYITLI